MLLKKINLIALITVLQASLSLFAFIPERTPPIIDSVQVEFNGYQNVSDQAVFARINISEGQAYDQTLVNQSIRSLYSTGFFKSIQVRSDELESNAIVLTFILEAKPKIRNIAFQGNKRIPKNKFLDTIKSKVDDYLDEAKLNTDVQELIEYYHKRGYSDVEIDFCTNVDECSGCADVVFDIIEGSKRRIKCISFEGHEPCSESELRDVMQTKKWNIFSFISGKGRFKQDELNEDLLKLKQFYRDHGYLDVEIPEDCVRLECPSDDSIAITIKIDPGRQYRFGCISIKNNKLFRTDKLIALVTFCSGDVFSPSKILQTEEIIRDAYGTFGYLDTFADAQRRPNIETGCVDIEIVVHESEKVCLESIKIQGNTTTKNNVILRELALAPGDVFDLVRMKSSQKRLENTRFFEEVSFTPEETPIPGRRNLLIAVKEGRTGSVGFTVSFSSLEDFVGSIEFSQSNFDLFSPKTKFQGAGQKFRVRARVGKNMSSFMVSFEEPWLWERELALGFDIFRNRSDYYSSIFNEKRIGFDVHLRKSLWGLVAGQLSYLLEEVDIFNVKKTGQPGERIAPKTIQDEEGKRTVSKLGLSLDYDTRDNLVYPTEGVHLNSNTELAGGVLGGQTKYVRVEAVAAAWYQVCETLNQVIVIGAETGTIMSYGNQRVPFFDKYFLGGPDDLRGFHYRDVGPKDPNASNEPLGGNTKARATVEYSIQVIDPLRFALFYDIGFLNAGDLNWSPNKYNDDWGFGLRLFVLGAPLKLDWGFPIHGDGINDKKKYQFNFGFSTTF